MKEVRAFSPCHITGFFEICDESENPLEKGSRGAGISISKGVVTTVRLEPSQKSRIEIRINGEKSNAETSLYVAQSFLVKAGRNYRLEVDHVTDVPIGAGFGSSGAGALGLALALNDALGLGLSKIEATQIAHVAEIKCRTGLGTVIAETYGGFEVRIKPGAPGIGELVKIPIKDDYIVVSLSLGAISTKEVLNNRDIREKINKAGRGLVKELLKDPSPSSFMRLSRKFAESSGLMTPRVKKMLTDLDERGFSCSMAMIGEAIFSLTKEGEADELIKILKTYTNEGVIISNIDLMGARLIE